MPYVISGNINSNRIVNIVRTLEFSKAFFHPIARGEELTSELLALKPDPFIVEAPARGGMPEIFGERLVWTIKEEVKQIIEDLEPSRHQLIPVNLRVKGSDKDWGQYYLLCPGQVIDAVVINETDFVEGKGRPEFMKSPALSPFGNTVLDGQTIEGRHLWRGGKGKIGGGADPFSRYLFCSDELAKRIKDAGVEGWNFRRCKTKLNS